MTTTITRDDAVAALATDGIMRTFARIIRHHSRPWLTADDIRDELDAAGITGMAVGATFRAASQRGWLTPDGYETSTSPNARGRAVRRWTVNARQVPAVDR